MVLDAKKVRYAAAGPALSVSVVIVWLALNVTGVMPTVVRPANDSVLNVFAPVIVMAVAAALVKLTLLNVRPPEAMPDVVPVRLIWLVPALKVRLVIVPALNAELDASEIVAVEAFKLIVLVELPEVVKPVQVIA